MIEERDWPLIDRYVAGECSPEEVAELERRCAVEPELRALAAAMRSGPTTEWEPDVNRAWAQVRARANEPDRVLSLVAWRRRLPRPTLRAPAWRIAAGLLLVAGGAAVWGLHLRTSGAAREAALRQVETRAGQTARLTLADGSRVQLAPESRLRFREGLRGRTRLVSLEGEAYFAVAHDASRPFVVEAGPAVARVLGTEFVVSARRGERAVQLVVSRGRVLFRPAGTPEAAGAILTRGDLGRIEAGRLALRHGVDLDRELDWTEGRLVFENAPVPEAFQRLERWYGVHLVVTDATLARRRFSGTIRSMPLPELLQALTLALDARWERRGETIEFSTQSPASAGD